MNEFDQAMAEFLANGGEVKTIPSGKSGIVPGQSNSPWGKKKKAVDPVEEIEDLAAAPDIIDLSDLVEEEEAAADDVLEDEE
jgi:hypothetical protein